MSQIHHIFNIQEFSFEYTWELWLPCRVVETDVIIANQLLKQIDPKIQIPKEFREFYESVNGYFKVRGISICPIHCKVTVYLSIPEHLKTY